MSKTDVKVMPRLVVFQRPPKALATYQMLGVLLIDGDVSDATRDQVGPDAAQRDSLERASGVSAFCAGLVVATADVSRPTTTAARTNSSISYRDSSDGAN